MFRHLTTFESADNKMGIIGQGKSTSLSPVHLEKQPRPPLGNPKKCSWDQEGCEWCSVGSHHRDMMGMVQKGLLHSWPFPVKGGHQEGLAAAWPKENPGLGIWGQIIVCFCRWGCCGWLATARTVHRDWQIWHTDLKRITRPPSTLYAWLSLKFLEKISTWS